MECYSCANRNVFALGFVPVKVENSAVLLCRDHKPHDPGLKDLDLDLSSWQALIEDRAFAGWLVTKPSEKVHHILNPLQHCFVPGFSLLSGKKSKNFPRVINEIVTCISAFDNWVWTYNFLLQCMIHSWVPRQIQRESFHVSNVLLSGHKKSDERFHQIST